jgi:uncharacterized protein YecT (DUF1311 family)
MIARFAPALALLWILGATSALAAPSFECNSAQNLVERAICADPGLAQLDAEIAVAYRSALDRLRSDPGLAALLRRQHEAFIESREAALQWPGASLGGYMRDWATRLDAVGEPRAGLEGVWINRSGSIVIEPRSAGGYAVRANGADPVRGSYTCEFIGLARLFDTKVLDVAWDTKPDEEDGADGWTLRIIANGGAVHLTQHRNESDAASAPFCGARGSLEGFYLPGRAPRAGGRR